MAHIKNEVKIRGKNLKSKSLGKVKCSKVRRSTLKAGIRIVVGFLKVHCKLEAHWKKWNTKQMIIVCSARNMRRQQNILTMNILL